MTDAEVLTTVAEVAAEIAKEIRAKGHFQNLPGQTIRHQSCLLANSAWDHASLQPYGDFERLMAVPSGQSMADFNDTTPTEVILDRLDKIASGEIQ